MLLQIKNLIEDIFLEIKNNLTSSKYVLKGKCKRCGQCCRCVLFSDEMGYITTEERFNKLKAKEVVYRFFEPNGVVEGEGEGVDGAIMFKCKHLTKENKCGIYFIRPMFCRKYPQINKSFFANGGVMLDDCGFKIEPDKSFKSYLK